MWYALHNVEAERGRMGLTRASLAETLDISKTTYKRYVDGTIPIPADKLCVLSNLFECSCDYLLGRTEMRKAVGVDFNSPNNNLV